MAAILATVVVATWVLVLQVVPAPQEPSYEGKRLSEWVIDLNGEFTVEQARALDAMGTNAIPHLLRWVAYDTPPWKTHAYRVMNFLRSTRNKSQITDRRLKLGDEAETALSRFVRDAPQIAVECRRLALQNNLPPRVRQRINYLLYREWTYRGGATNLQLMVMTNGPPRSAK